jgi:hypothetical protein
MQQVRVDQVVVVHFDMLVQTVWVGLVMLVAFLPLKDIVVVTQLIIILVLMLVLEVEVHQP